MRIREAIAVGLLLATQTAVSAAQRTGDQARLVFTINGAYIGSKGLWSVPDQLVAIDELPTNHRLNRSASSTFGAALGATYYPKDKLGLTAEAFLLGLGYDDGCRVTTPGESRCASLEVCEDIDEQDKSAAAVVRLGGRHLPLRQPRVHLALPSSGRRDPVRQPELDPDAGREHQQRRRAARHLRRRRADPGAPGIELGVGATMVLSRGYHLRWEVRDNIVGVEEVTGPVTTVGAVPPHETNFEHVWSVLIGLDVILERERGRRY